MPSDKASYLAAHYLSADTKPSSSTKKRKRKGAAASSGLLITDDDETGWGGSAPAADGAEDDDLPVAVAGTTAEFRRAKKSGWKTLGGGTPKTNTTKDEAAAADAIIASAAAETAAAAARELAEAEGDPALLMSNGTQAGLQSAASLTAQLRRRQALDAAELAQLKLEQQQQQAQEGGGGAGGGRGQEDSIILRDATGRRVDASLLRAEARRQQAEAERAARAKQELLRGEVQAAESRARRAALEEAAVMPLARGADDAALNAELAGQERWNDPMAQFLSNSNSGVGATGGEGGGGRKGKGGAGRRPVYKGAAPPNRYGIRPGYRWDGVDRGNGFEAERFRALNRREMNKGLEYAWQMDE